MIDMPVLRAVPLKRGETLRSWEFMEDYYLPYRGAQLFTAKGAIFNGASIPPFARSYYNPTGILFLPSINHDSSYEKHEYISYDFGQYFTIKVNQLQADDMFREIAYQYYPEHKKKIWFAYKMLRARGHIAWNKHRVER